MNTTNFDKKLECGNDFVAVRVLENCETLKIGNIYLPDQAKANDRLALCKIESIGKSAAEKTGCKIDDYVMIDRLATYAHTIPCACLKYDSVICLTNEKGSEFFPLKDMLFVEPEDKEDVAKVGNVFVLNPEDRLNLGKIVKMNFEKSDAYPFEVGNKVMLTKGADVVDFGEQRIHIYKKDMIIATVED